MSIKLHYFSIGLDVQTPDTASPQHYFYSDDFTRIGRNHKALQERHNIYVNKPTVFDS